MQVRTFAQQQLWAIFAFLPILLSAQLNLTAEYRPRTEYRHGYKTMLNQDGSIGKVVFLIKNR